MDARLPFVALHCIRTDLTKKFTRFLAHASCNQGMNTVTLRPVVIEVAYRDRHRFLSSDVPCWGQSWHAIPVDFICLG